MQIVIIFYINGKHIVLISIFDVGFNLCLYTAILLQVLSVITLFYRIIYFILQMNKVYKKALFSIFAIISLSFNLFAQQNHFVYLQTENKQPFYIKLDNKILSSSASGYLIISKLQEGAYTLTIGFPKNEWPEQNVTCSVNKKDAGYLLKDFGDKGWGLFNLQTMEVAMSGTKPAVKTAVAEETKTDVFSNTLSNVVNDPSIIKKSEDKTVVKEAIKPAEEAPQKETIVNKNPTVVTDSPAVDKKEDKPAMNEEVKPEKETVKPVIEIGKNEVIANLPTVKIKRLLSVISSEGTEIVYADITGVNADTIRLFIPAEKTGTVQPEKETVKPVIETVKKEEPAKTGIKKEEVQKEEIKKQETQVEQVNKPEQKNGDPKFIDIELPNPNAKKDSASAKVKTATAEIDKKNPVEEPIIEKPKDAAVKPAIGNSDCKAFATEEEFLKLRKKMAAENSDDDMVNAAKKLFRSRCFTTEQVKNLSVLFLKDEGKYKFFDAAYPFVSDSYNFSQLESQLSDNYFITRFRAMIRH